MRTYNIAKRSAVIFIIFSVVVLVITNAAMSLLNTWTKDIISGQKVLVELVSDKLNSTAAPVIDSLSRKGFFESDSISKKKSDFINTRLKSIVSAELAELEGFEGGFFLTQFNEFYGYAFPTSPPPVPAFGPPPRSYGFIKEQAIKSIKENKLIVNLYKFDPAVFPLATRPLLYNNKIIGSVWARVHIERELPYIKLNQVYSGAAVIFAVGFLILLFYSARTYNRMKEIKRGLVAIQTEDSFRFSNRKGIFGFINSSINKLVDNLTELHAQKQRLEKELYHRDKMATLGKLIAGVAHEVKTPLAIIKTRIQIWERELKKKNLRSGELDIASGESMQLVVKEIDRLASLVNKLLVFSKPVADNFRLININNLLSRVVELLQIKELNNIEFQLALEPDLPLLNCDPDAIEQVLLNVLSNSLEAVGENGKIAITTEIQGEEPAIRISVADNGRGIPDDIADKLFDPFFTTKANGAGLGLSISYEIVMAHKGTITFAKNIPDGTICIITLPVKKNEHE